jgi:hypothetical protein
VVYLYKFVGKKGQLYILDIKMNSNCKQEEKTGTGPGSCGGNTDKNDRAQSGPASNKSPKLTEVINNGKNPEMVAAIKYYTGEGFREINHGLRYGNELTPEAQEHSEWLDAILEDDRAILSEGIVYRGYNSESLLTDEDDDIIGSIISSPAFVSASHNQANAEVFIDTAKYPVMAEIQIPDGAKGYAIPSHMTEYDVGESEVLLPRDSEFEIIDRKERDGITWIIMKLVS